MTMREGGFIYASFYLIPAVSMGLGAGGVGFFSFSLSPFYYSSHLSLPDGDRLLACYALFILRR